MTKKEFKLKCQDQTFTGWNGHKVRINAFYFDFKQGEINNRYFGGYKFMLAANVQDLNKAELFELFYQWVNREIDNLPWYVKMRYAETDEQRFKLSLSMKM